MRRDYLRGVCKIAASGTTSDPLDVSAYAFGSIQLPASMTGTEIAIEVSNFKQTDIDNKSSWVWETPSNYDGTPIGNITVAANLPIVLHPALFAFQRVRFISNGTEAAAREIIYTLKP